MRSDFKKKQKTPLTRTLASAELVEVVAREMQLTPEQVTSMASSIPILVGPAEKEKLLRVFRGGNLSPSLYVYKVDRNMTRCCISRSFLRITAAVATAISLFHVLLLSAYFMPGDTLIPVLAWDLLYSRSSCLA